MEKYIPIRQSANQKRRRLVAFFLIFASALFAFRLMRGSPKQTAVLELSPSLQKSDRTLTALLKGRVSEPVSEENVTEKIIQKYQEEVFRLNQDKKGKTAISPSEITTPPDEFLAELLSNEVSEDVLSIPLFTSADARIVSSTPERVKEYAEAYERISSRNLGNQLPPYLTAAYEALLESKPSSLRAHVRAAEAQVSDLLKLQVPDDALPLHLELLNIWNRRALIGNALLDQNDPLKRLLALNALSEAIEKETRVVALMAALSSSP
ncbi:MAG: hypothetical protein Q8R20_03390 [Nanoarchaeota archaeon]|nr:hypothetical protein [Nanoarchaeota archaeon]